MSPRAWVSSFIAALFLAAPFLAILWIATSPNFTR